MSRVVLLNTVTDDPELEEVYEWFQMNLREMMGPGRELQGGPTWTMRDFLRIIAAEAPRAYGELLRKANS